MERDINMDLVNKMTAVELVKYITENFHEPLRSDLRDVNELMDIIEKKYKYKYQDIELLPELFHQFRTEILKHITKEDFVTFPTIIKYERIYTDHLIHVSDDVEIMGKLVNDVQMKNEHGEFNSYLNSILTVMNGSKMNGLGIKEFDEAKKLFEKIHDDNILHSRLENDDLYHKGKELQKKLKETLSDYI